VSCPQLAAERGETVSAAVSAERQGEDRPTDHGTSTAWTRDGPGETGAGGRTRTDDLLITNQLLYQLSYAGRLELSAFFKHLLFVTLVAWEFDARRVGRLLVARTANVTETKV
jgi:hypothetical protein